jgi:histidyl-tRNA synthetase
MARVTPRILSGFVELLPEDQIQFNKMFDTIRGVYESYGYAPIETPAIELGEVLLAKAGGETEKQIYKIARDKDDKDMALHFDLTVPLARYVAQHEGELVFPFRRYQMQKVWRGERSQAGRYREFYQCDIDVIGSNSVLYDAEMPAVISSVFRKLSIGSFTIRVNNRKILQGYLESIGAHHISAEVLRVIDKLEKIGEAAVVSELVKLGVEEQVTQKLLAFLSTAGTVDEVLEQLGQVDTQNTRYLAGLEELRGVVDGMRRLGLPDEDYVIDLKIARGLDYYTGTVYETNLDDFPGVGSVCSGGRYDDLASYYTKSKLPGVGVSIGLTRLFMQLKEIGLVSAGAKTMSRAVILPLTTDATARALEVATQLRAAGIAVETYMEQSQPSKMMRYVDRLGAPYAIVIGEDELASGQVVLKNMETGEQPVMGVQEVIKRLSADN